MNNKNKNNRFETKLIISAHEIGTRNESEAPILLKEEVNNEIRKYIARLSKQLRELTRLIQGKPRAHRPNVPSKAGTSAKFSAAGPSPNMMTGSKSTSFDRKVAN